MELKVKKNISKVQKRYYTALEFRRSEGLLREPVASYLACSWLAGRRRAIQDIRDLLDVLSYDGNQEEFCKMWYNNLQTLRKIERRFYFGWHFLNGLRSIRISIVLIENHKMALASITFWFTLREHLLLLISNKVWVTLEINCHLS